MSEQQWRLVLRQLTALGHVQAEGEYSTLVLTDSAREVLRGEVPVRLRVPIEAKARGAKLTRVRSGAAVGGSPAAGKAPPVALDEAATALFLQLKAWRAEVAREHNLPAYVVFHDATLAEMARQRPGSLDELGGISGVGSKKLQAYGAELLRLLGA